MKKIEEITTKMATAHQTDLVMGKQESYEYRRALFKNIWNTAMTSKDNQYPKKKVIHTMRMDDVDPCPVGISENQRIKNLRCVCRHILRVCKKQEISNRLYNKRNADDASPVYHEARINRKRRKLQARIKKHRKTEALTELIVPKLGPPTEATVQRLAVVIKPSDEYLLGNSSTSSASSTRNKKPKCKKALLPKIDGQWITKTLYETQGTKVPKTRKKKVIIKKKKHNQIAKPIRGVPDSLQQYVSTM